MLQNIVFKIVMLPFSLLYGLGIGIRDFLYRKEILKSVEFDMPVISVGNLSVGGSGKTPHIEYLIRLLKDYINIATLSRGYKHKTSGFLEVLPTHTAEDSGDEPLQFKRKYPEIMVAVGENRVFAIPEILKASPYTQTILLDDAFQHLAVRPGHNILLTEYSKPFTRDFLMPSGRLREWRSAYKRADTIIISKCPQEAPTLEEKERLVKEINPFSHQQVFFSYYKYLTPYYIFNHKYGMSFDKNTDVLLVCAIAGSDYLASHLKKQARTVKVLEFEDHHYFTKHDVSRMKTIFDNLESKRKVIITTEKDAIRLALHREFIVEHKLPLFSIPIEVAFHYGEGMLFDERIKQFLLNFRA